MENDLWNYLNEPDEDQEPDEDFARDLHNKLKEDEDEL